MSVKGQISKALQSNQRILILTHIYPDGDCIGSSLALALGLKSIGKDVTIADDHAVPPAYAFLPASSEIVFPHGIVGTFDLVVAVDASDKGRLGNASHLLDLGRTTINIDHHRTNENFAMINWVEPSAAASGELIYSLLNTMNIRLSREIAVCLYTALSTDTGSFRFSNTTEKTFKIASHLVELGVNPGDIGENVFDTKPLSALKLLGALLGELTISECGNVAWMTLTKEMMNRFAALPSDIEGFVNYARMVDGVSVALLFREEGDSVKVSWRGRGNVDVAALASRFGGGGHSKAAGCTIEGNIGEVRSRVIDEVCSYLSGCGCQ